MINGFVFPGRLPRFIGQRQLLKSKTGLSTLAQLQKDQTDILARAVPHQTQPLGLQMKGPCLGDDLSQPFRAVDQEKVAAVFQRPGGAVQQLPDGAAVLPPGQGQSAALRSAGKIGRVGEECGEASGGNQGGNLPHIRTYTFHAVGKRVAGDVVKSGPVGLMRQFYAGDAAGAVPGAEQQPQGTAAGTKVQHPGVFGELCKPAKEHTVSAQGEAAFGDIQGKTVQKCFQVVFLIVKTGLRKTQAGGFRRISLPRWHQRGTARRRSRS